ncbi:MAG: cellulase N-terminal Ig-like domain-containing protein, partial [Gemmatimonadaceae bacterium]
MKLRRSRIGLLLGLCLTLGGTTPQRATAPRLFIRVNQVGYLSGAPKVAVLCALDAIPRIKYSVTDSTGRTMMRRYT